MGLTHVFTVGSMLVFYLISPPADVIYKVYCTAFSECYLETCCSIWCKSFMDSSQALSIHFWVWMNILTVGVTFSIPRLPLFLYRISDHCYNKINPKKQIHIQKIKSIPHIQHLLHVWNFRITNSRRWTPSLKRKPHLMFLLETNLSQSIPLQVFTIILPQF